MICVTKSLFLLFVLLLTFIPVQGHELKGVTLNECITIALTGHPEILAGKALVKEKKEEVQEARSRLYPSLLGSGSFAHSTPPLTSTFGPFVFGLDTDNSFSTGVTLKYSLFNGGRTQNSLKAAGLAFSSQKLMLESVTLQQIMNVKIAFYRVLLARDFVRLYRYGYQLAGVMSNTTKQLYRTGAQPRLAYNTAYVRELDAKQDFLNAQTEYQEQLDSLSVAMGLKPGSIKGITGALLQLPMPSYKGLLLAAYQENPVLRKDVTEIRKQKVLLQIAKAISSPDVSLFSTNAFFTNPFLTFHSVYQNQSGIQVTWAFEFGKQGAKEEEVNSFLKVAQVKYQEDRDEVGRELLAAYSDAAKANQEINTFAESIRKQRLSFDDARSAFFNNLISETQYDEVDDLFMKQLALYLNSLYNYNEALARIAYLTGKKE